MRSEPGLASTRITEASAAGHLVVVLDEEAFGGSGRRPLWVRLNTDPQAIARAGLVIAQGQEYADLLTGVFTLAPLAVFDRRPGAIWAGVILLLCGVLGLVWLYLVRNRISFAAALERAAEAPGGPTNDFTPYTGDTVSLASAAAGAFASANAGAAIRPRP